MLLRKSWQKANGSWQIVEAKKIALCRLPTL
jgi:hypothetical protein